MQTIERYGPSVRLAVNLAAVLYLLVAMFRFGISAQENGRNVERSVIESQQKIAGQERRMDRMDHDLDKLNLAQRLAKIETCIQAAKEATEGNQQLLRAVLGGVALMLLGTLIRAVGAVRRRRGR